MTRLLSPTPEVLSRRLACACEPADVLVTFAAHPGVFALESVCNTGGYGNLTIIGCAPIDKLDVGITAGPEGTTGAFAQLAAAIDRQPMVSGCNVPFPGGWVGYIPYEAGAALENVRRAGDAAPDGPRMRFALYDSAVVYDHEARIWDVCAVDLPQSKAPASRRVAELTTLLRSAESRAGRQAARNRPLVVARPTPNMTKRDYLKKVNRAIRYIEAGDIYQVNLTQRFSTRTDADPLGLYLKLREANPADYAAYLRWGDRAVLSSSPELFLDSQPEGRVVTRPIKGTRPRSGDAVTDAARGLALLASAKDRAELNMIIDLLRNDLGKVCEFGSVRVLRSHEIEAHPTVWHLVATIEGRLRRGVSQVDLLRATFPGGSITGCPKIRAMQIINELEPSPRDVYCGSIGYLSLEGRMSVNIAIRTMVYDAGRLHVYAGGAVTADSEPEAEYHETLAKAEGMFRALGHSTAELVTGRRDHRDSLD